MPDNYLLKHREEMPVWLSDYKDGDPFPRNFSNPVWCITQVLETMAMPSGSSIQHIAPIAIYMLIMEFQKAQLLKNFRVLSPHSADMKLFQRSMSVKRN